MDATALMDNLVPVSTFSHGGASKAFAKVGTGKPVIVLKNNKPSAVIITPDDYSLLTEAMEDWELYQEAMQRIKDDDGTLYTLDEALEKDYKPVEDGYEPEFE